MSGRCNPAVVVTRPRASMMAVGWCKPAVVDAPLCVDDGHVETRPRGRQVGRMPPWQ
jgi:hypothetical protein